MGGAQRYPSRFSMLAYCHERRSSQLPCRGPFLRRRQMSRITREILASGRKAAQQGDGFRKRSTHPTGSCQTDSMSPAHQLERPNLQFGSRCERSVIGIQTLSPPRSCGSQPKISKTTPCKVAASRRHGCALGKYLTRRANQRHSFIIARSVKRPWPRNSALFLEWSR